LPEKLEENGVSESVQIQIGCSVALGLLCEEEFPIPSKPQQNYAMRQASDEPFDQMLVRKRSETHLLDCLP
jgi:hypothetical protein